MHKQRADHIINVSSVGGRTSSKGLSAYQAAKWAVGGFMEVLAKEAVAFGVKLVAIEPGGMRTNWGFVAHQAAPVLNADYEPSAGAKLALMRRYAGSDVGDPRNVAVVVVDLSRCDTVPAHLVLGNDALYSLAQAETTRIAEAKEWAEVSSSIDFEGSDLSLLQ